jgi:hypothetical protein
MGRGKENVKRGDSFGWLITEQFVYIQEALSNWKIEFFLLSFFFHFIFNVFPLFSSIRN